MNEPSFFAAYQSDPGALLVAVAGGAAVSTVVCLIAAWQSRRDFVRCFGALMLAFVSFATLLGIALILTRDDIR